MKPCLLPMAIAFFLAAKTAIADVSGGYMSRIGNGGNLSYLRLTQASDKLTGYLQQIVLDSKARNGYITSRDEIDGVVSGGEVSLKIGGNWNRQGNREFDGTASGNILQLGYPMRDGSVLKVTFTRTSIDGWNSAASKFKSDCKQRVWTLRAAQMNVALAAYKAKRGPEIQVELIHAQNVVAEAVTAIIRWQDRVNAATSKSAELQARYDSTKQRLEEVKKQHDDLRDEYNKAQPIKSKAEGDSFVERGKKVVEDGRQSVERLQECTKALSDNQGEIMRGRTALGTDLDIMFVNRDKVNSLRNEASKLGVKLLDPNPVIASTTQVLAENAKVFSRANEQSPNGDHLTRASIINLVGEINGFYVFVASGKRLAFVRKVDVVAVK